MFAKAAWLTALILGFRAGPQDFPYSAPLTRVIVVLAVAAGFLECRLTLPVTQAILQAIISVAAVAAYSYSILQIRGLASRLQQTCNALYAAGGVLTLLLLPPLSMIAPQLVRLAENPELMRTEPLPTLPSLAVALISFWNFAVSVHIYRHALNVSLWVGAAASLLGAFVNVSAAGLVGIFFTR